MKVFKSNIYFLLLILFNIPHLSAQEIEIDRINIINRQINIDYKIDDSNENNEYWVQIYSSKDNFSAPLTKLSGDVGQEVKPGERTATWDIIDEYGEYKGPLMFEVRASVYIPFVRLKKKDIKDSYKRGKPLDLNWRPGNTNPVHIELYKNNKRLQGELNYPNDGEYSTVLSKDLKPGKNYKIKITDSKNSDQFIFTEPFSIKRRIPLLLQIIPGVAVLGVATPLGVSYLTEEGQGGDNSLPDAPSSPENN
ncbi:MAG: Ser-Thr-rich GPI-anchored membrane family protein [Bacteroidota bacterium]